MPRTNIRHSFEILNQSYPHPSHILNIINHNHTTWRIFICGSIVFHHIWLRHHKRSFYLQYMAMFLSTFKLGLLFFLISLLPITFFLTIPTWSIWMHSAFQVLVHISNHYWDHPWPSIVYWIICHLTLAWYFSAYAFFTHSINTKQLSTISPLSCKASHFHKNHIHFFVSCCLSKYLFLF